MLRTQLGNELSLNNKRDTIKSYASVVSGVVILSIRLSVTRLHCDKTK